ncbi:hypothetical protein H257_16173 [Aphanomyces astaci]|uniref:Uncharacterized protein n=1 Tax=Aphanomyces astaci TaxID=112090 RepID=W4FLZ3_APHAT|nr:hypothetical protein H257_16173 [Aphanomyces astaci]ETV67708.1 hypothetical protein H257_16173 [Aphanomyces astaci]|eukprot:XP_009842829.1 hypothetical protein H257_16173 [Aphanomyces astaci]
MSALDTATGGRYREPRLVVVGHADDNSAFGIQAVFSVVSFDLLHQFLAAYVSRLVLGAVLTAVTILLCLVETVYALRYANAIMSRLNVTKALLREAGGVEYTTHVYVGSPGSRCSVLWRYLLHTRLLQDPRLGF